MLVNDAIQTERRLVATLAVVIYAPDIPRGPPSQQQQLQRSKCSIVKSAVALI